MKPLIITLSLLNGMDAGSTQIALNRGAVEANVVRPSQPIMNAVTMGLFEAYELYGLKKIAKTRPRTATLLAVAAIVGESIVVANNVHTIQEVSHVRPH
jgi:hypothetical protein